MRRKVDLLVFDKNEKLAAILSKKANKMLKYFDDEVTEQLNRDFVLSFSAPANHRDSDYLVEGGYVGYYDADGEFQYFQIFNVEEERQGKRLTKKVLAEHAVYENTDNIVTDLRVDAQGPEIAMPKALDGSRWVAGQVDALAPQTINYYYSDSMKNIRETAELYKGELRYRVISDGHSITNRYVDLLFRRGSDTGMAFEYKRNMSYIRRTVESSGIKTALYGRGKGEQIEQTGGYTRKVTFADIEWSVANGDPVDKPLGQEWVGDPTALATYGRAGGTRHRFGTVDFDTENPVELLEKTWDQLQKVCTPLVTYELQVTDLERLTGQLFRKYRLGDTVFVIDRELGILIEARIIEVKSGLNGKNSQVILGNFIPDIADYNKRLEKTNQTISDRKGVWDKPVDNTSFPDLMPGTPSGCFAAGLFRSINVTWDFVADAHIAAYEVYASKVLGFTADASNLVFRGKTGGHLHEADVNETWYFRVRAVNTHGTPSELSPEFSATTRQMKAADYENLSIGNAAIANISADKINFGTLDGSKATITNIDASNIKVGVLDAERVRIGVSTVFDENYDPSVMHDYFDFLPTGLKIGQHQSPLQINISNQQMDFLDNGVIVAYVNGQKMFIDSLEVLNSVIVGNHKIEKYNTNITLVKWVGV